MTDSMSDLLKQAQKMQNELTEKQEEMKSVEVTGSSGAGLVCAVMNGCHNIIRINIDKSLDLALEGIGQVLLRKGNHLDGILKLREATGSIGFNPKKSSITIY